MPNGRKYKGKSLSSKVASAAARSSGSRAAAVSAARGAVRRSSSRRRVVRAPRAGATGGQPVGLAQYLTLQHKPLPRYSKLEMTLERYGALQLNQWRRFNAFERFHVQPDSGKTMWAGVPFKLTCGTALAQSALDTDWVPNNCDVYDVARKMAQGYTDQAPATVRSNPYSATAFVSQTAGDQSGDLPFAANAFGSAYGAYSNLQALSIKNNSVEVMIENVSSLDAFVEEWELVYRKPMVVGEWFTNRDASGLSAVAITRGGTANDYLGGWDQSILAPTGPVSAVPGNINPEPALFNGRDQYPYTGHLNPYTTGGVAYTRDTKQYGTRLAGCALEQYARMCIRDREQQALVTPLLQPNLIRNAEVIETVGVVTAEVLLCNPMNDPSLAWPRGKPNTCGWRLRRVRRSITLKPGQSRHYKLPVDASFVQNLENLPRVADKRMDWYMAQKFGTTTSTNTEIRDTSSLPSHMKFRFFRVYGDMISNRNLADTTADSDYQTGSCRVMFMIKRAMDVRWHSRTNIRQVDPLFAFNTSVALASQEALNDETDIPQNVAIAGDAA